jgi:hypothetical protein
MVQRRQETEVLQRETFALVHDPVLPRAWSGPTEEAHRWPAFGWVVHTSTSTTTAPIWKEEKNLLFCFELRPS